MTAASRGCMEAAECNVFRIQHTIGATSQGLGELSRGEFFRSQVEAKQASGLRATPG